MCSTLYDILFYHGPVCRTNAITNGEKTHRRIVILVCDVANETLIFPRMCHRNITSMRQSQNRIVTTYYNKKIISKAFQQCVFYILPVNHLCLF